jgi:hypothetical protein
MRATGSALASRPWENGMVPRLLKSRRGWAVVLALAGLAWLVTPRLRGLLMQCDPAVPWVVELGRGSGMHGLDTVKVFQDGTVVLHRRDAGGWPAGGADVTRFTLPEHALSQVLDGLAKYRLLDLEPVYRRGVRDGTQWVLRVKQGAVEKAVYCDNRFPEQVRQFAADLDALLARHGLGMAAWCRVDYGGLPPHEQELWDSIRR